MGVRLRELHKDGRSRVVTTVRHVLTIQFIVSIEVVEVSVACSIENHLNVIRLWMLLPR